MRLESGSRQRAQPRVDLAHAPVAPPEVDREAEVLAAQLHVVAAAPVVRRRVVVANGLGVLEDVEELAAPKV